MYSINGRLKKEVSSDTNRKQRKHKVVCQQCHFVLDASKEFGENIACPKCGSTDLIYELNDE